MELNFKVMFMDEVVAHIIIKNNTLIKVDIFNNVPYKQPFLKQPVSLKYIRTFLEKRAISQCKNDNSETHLSESEVIDILKETHGASFDDFLWVKFTGENINWNEIKLR